MAFKTIGQTTAVMAEAGTASRKTWRQDGNSGNTQFPFGQFKALATVGEIDPSRKNKLKPKDYQALTGVPDGSGAWLKNNSTVRIAYQSESVGPIWERTPSIETYPWTMKSGATFTGSKIHYIDYSRKGLANYLNNKKSASKIVKGSGLLFNEVFNVFGEKVTPLSSSEVNYQGRWGNQATPFGNHLNLADNKETTTADFLFQSFCGSWFESSNKYGKGIGFHDNIWLNSEEWNIANKGAFSGINPDKKYDSSEDWSTAAQTMGLASLITDVNKGVAYTAPALGQSGYEKIVPINPQSNDYVVMVLSGYNYYYDPAPIRIYIGQKGVNAQGESIDNQTSSAQEQFLARNGLLHGQIYGLSINQETSNAMGMTSNFWTREATVNIDDNTNGLKEYLTNDSGPNQFKGRFYPTSYKWEGFNKPVAVGDTEIYKWSQESEQPAWKVEEGLNDPDGYFFLNGNTKMEHSAPDPRLNSRFVQNMTGANSILGIDLKNLKKEITRNDHDSNGLPDFISANVRRILTGADDSLRLKTGGQGIAHRDPKDVLDGNNSDGKETAKKHVGKNRFGTESPDGLAWVAGKDGDLLIVDEDSKNPYGERKFALPINNSMKLRGPATGYFLAQAGGQYSPRAKAKASAMGDTFYKTDEQNHRDAEFSSSWDITSLLAKNKKGKFYSKKKLSGRKSYEIQNEIPLNEHTFLGVVQMRGEADGQVNVMEADGGGQVLLFNIDFNSFG